VSVQWIGTINVLEAIMGGVGTGNFSTAQVVVGATPVLLVAARAGRASVRVSNFGSNPVFVGPSNTVTIGTGQIVGGELGGQSESFPTQAAIYAVAATGISQQVSVAEFF
jgi:hypothetical protein